MADNKIREVPLHRIKFPFLPMRKYVTEAEVSSLAQSIREIGLISPVLLRRSGKDYELIAGHRRVKAFKSLMRTQIPAIIVEADDIHTHKSRIAENLHREDIRPSEEAEYYISVMKELGINQRELADLANKSASYVSERLAITNYPEFLRTALDEGVLAFSVCRILAQIGDPEVLRQFTKYAVDYGCNPKTASEWVKEWRLDQTYTPPPDEPAAVDIDSYEAPQARLMQNCFVCEVEVETKDIRHIATCPACFESLLKSLSKRPAQTSTVEH